MTKNLANQDICMEVPHTQITKLFFSTELAGHLGKILASPSLWNSHFDWRLHYDITRQASFSKISNAPHISSLPSFASVPDNCELCDQLVSGQLGLPNIYEDIFTWLVRC